MVATELLSCPFCGGKPGLDCWHQDFDFGDGDVRRTLFSMVRCLDCGAQTDLQEDGVSTDIENEELLEAVRASWAKKWNRRV